jgi:hypothetical protein
MIFVSEYEVNNFCHCSILIGNTINIEHRDRLGKFKESESGVFGIITVNKLSGCTTVY